jgi:hypothetical protein
MILAGEGVDGVSAGWLGFLIVVLLCVVTALLIRNMNARLRRLPKSYEDDASQKTDDAGSA